MKTTKILSFLMVSFLLYSCSAIAKNENEKNVTKQIPAGNFNSINLTGMADVIYTQEKTGVSLTAPENIIGLIDVSVSNNTLGISTRKLKNSDMKKGTKIIIKAGSPDLASIKISGAGDIMLKGAISLKKLNVTGEGASDLKAENLNCQILNLNLSGAGDVLLNGKAQSAAYTIEGAGDIDAYNFKVNSLTVDMKGAGDIKCNASEISINNDGVGNIKYKGTPVIKKIENSGLGSVEAVK